MASISAVRIINILPKGLISYVSRKVIDYFLKRYATISITGFENLENLDSPVIFVCNHLSNSDGLVLNKVLKSMDPTFVAGVKLSKSSVTSIGIHAVKTTAIKPNTADVAGLKKAVNLIKQGENLVIFPEGTRSRKASLIEGKKGILLIARMTGVPIVPIGICGTEKLLPISKNENMENESFHKANVSVHIGKAFFLPQKDKNQDKKEYETFAVNAIMKKIAELLPEKYQGIYKNLN